MDSTPSPAGGSIGLPMVHSPWPERIENKRPLDKRRTPQGEPAGRCGPLGAPDSVNGSAFVLPYRRCDDLRQAGGNPMKAILVAAAMLGASGMAHAQYSGGGY